MSDAVLTTPIQTSGYVVVAIAIAWIGRKVNKIGHEMNSMKDQLAKVTGEKEFARREKSEKDKQTP